MSSAPWAVKLDPQWSGHYYFGDGLGVNCYLVLGKDGTFQFRWTGCLGTYDQNEGTYSVNDQMLFLSPKLRNLRRPFGGTPTRFLTVRWDDRTYLIPEGEIRAFCDAVREGHEPRRYRFGLFYLREGDEEKPSKGLPALPKQWLDYLGKLRN